MHATLLTKSSLLRSLVALAAASVSLPACSDVDRSASAAGVARGQQAIVYGQVSGPEDDSVVMTVAKESTVTYRCTGTLVAPNLVITARHCVSHFVELPFTCTSDGELTPSSRGGTMGALYEPSAVSVRVGGGPNPPLGANAVQLLAVQTPSICRNDIAFIVLDRMLPDLPIHPIRLFKGTEPGENLRVVGYGVDENDFFGIRHTRDDLVISEVGPSEFRMPGDDVPPRTFVTEGPALCIGDSGGPAFVDSTVVSGVWSQVVGDCKAPGARNYFTEVAPFADTLVLPAFEAAGAEPWLEGNSGPGLGNRGGSPGTGGGVGSGGVGGDAAGGEAPTETGGTAGNVGSGGSVGSGGDSSSAGAPESGGTMSVGGGASSGVAGTDGAGVRKKGGCTCGVVGAPSSGAEFLLVPLLAFALARRRRGVLIHA